MLHGMARFMTGNTDRCNGSTLIHARRKSECFIGGVVVIAQKTLGLHDSDIMNARVVQHGLCRLGTRDVPHGPNF